MCKWQNVCLHLLPWKETSAAGCQRPPVWLRPAAADWPACRTDLLSARAKAAAGRSVRGETAVLLDRPVARHLRQCGYAPFAQMKAWCVKYGSDRKSSLHAGSNRLTGFSCMLEGLKLKLKWSETWQNCQTYPEQHSSLGRKKIDTGQLCKTFLINNLFKHSALFQPC